MVLASASLGLPSCSEATMQRPLEEFPVLGVHALSARGNLVHSSSTTILGIWVLHVEYGTLDSSEMTLSGCAMLGSAWIRGLRQYLAFERISHNFYVDVDSDPEVFLSFLTWNGEACSADASARCPLVRCSHLELWKLFSWHPLG